MRSWPAASPFQRLLLTGAALLGAVGCGQLVPWTLGIANPALDAALNTATAIVAFLSSLALIRAVAPPDGAPRRSHTRTLFHVIAVYLVLAATLTLAVSASTRLPSLMEINAQAPRALGAFAAFVTLLFAIQWAVVGVWRDLAGAAVVERVRVPVATPEPAVAPAAAPVPIGVTVPARPELLQNQPGTAG